jgi:biotin carboxylase
MFVNDYLRVVGGFTMPKTFTASSLAEVAKLADDIPYPDVAKPIRGRGSFGVKICHNPSDLLAHTKELSDNSMAFIVEEFLQGEEVTVTVMPPAAKGQGYWSLPIVTRFNHQDGIAPYNGVVAVTANSRVLPESEADPLHHRLACECERAASLLGLTAPIRIDARRFKDSSESPYALFDLNMKPVS